MIRTSILALAVAAALNPVTAQALALGDITLHSALNERLSADVSLHRVDDNELEALSVVLASPEAFARIGLDRPYYLTGLSFSAKRTPDGLAVVQISSKEVIRDPFVNFLIEVNWSKGKLLREYTLLLDPPTSYRGAAAQIQAPITDTTGSIARPAEDAGASSYKVPVNDTLWAIAKRHRYQGVTDEQMLQAIFRNNPDAFIRNDINRLKAGKVLRIPSAQAMAAASPAKARHERLAKTSAWDATTPTPGTLAPPPHMPIDAKGPIQIPEDKGDHVEILTPDTQKAPAPGKASFEEHTLGQLEKDLLLARELNERVNSENTELQGRLKYLESQLADLQRLLKLKHDGAAQLQEEALLRQQAEQVQAKIEEVKSTAALAPVEEAAKPEVAAEPVAPAPVEEAAKPEVAAEPVAPAPVEEAAKPEVAAEPVAPAPVEEAAKPEVAAEPVAPAPVEEAAKPEVAAEPVAPAPVEEAAKPEAAAEPVAPAPVEEAAKPEAAAPAAGQDWLTLILDNPMILAGGGGLVLVILALVATKRRQGTTSPKAEPSKTLDMGPLGVGVAPAVAATMAADTELVAKDIGKIESDDSSLLIDLTPSELVGMRDTSAVDVMSEVDVLMAYGKYQEVQKKLQDGLEREPNRTDIKLKLLEVLYAAGKKSEFLSLSGKCLGQRLPEQDPEGWARIAILGRELDPDNPVFQIGVGPVPSKEAGKQPESEVLQFTSVAQRIDEPGEGLGLDLDNIQKAPYAAVLADVAQDIADLDEPLVEQLKDSDLVDFVQDQPLPLSSSIQMPDSAALEGLADLSYGELDLSDLDVTRLEMDSQMMPAGFEAAEFKEQKPKHFEHEDLLGQDRDLDVASEPLIDFSSAEDQVLLSSIDATTQIQGLDADSKSDAQQDGGGSDIGAARVDLASELSFLTQELEGIGADSELHLRTLDAGIDNTEFLESLADGKLDLADYDLGKDSINLDQELAGLDGLDAGSLMISQPTSGFSEDRVSNFDFEKELANLGNLGLDPEPHKAETAEDLDLGDMDLIGSGDDLKQELSDLSFLDDETGSQDKIQTMLDLAEAYIQMGDAEGAREILIEVQQEGGQAQQAKAKAMLDSIKPH